MEKEIKRLILKCWYGKDWHIEKIMSEIYFKLKVEVEKELVEKVINDVEAIL